MFLGIWAGLGWNELCVMGVWDHVCEVVGDGDGERFVGLGLMMEMGCVWGGGVGVWVGKRWKCVVGRFLIDGRGYV